MIKIFQVVLILMSVIFMIPASVMADDGHSGWRKMLSDPEKHYASSSVFVPTSSLNVSGWLSMISLIPSFSFASPMDPVDSPIVLSTYIFGVIVGEEGSGRFSDGTVNGVWYPQESAWIIYEGHDGNTLQVNPASHPEWDKYISHDPNFIPCLPQ